MIGVVHYYRRKKDSNQVRLIIIMVVVSVIALALGFALNSLARSEGVQNEVTTVVVKSGDTVWGCVRRIYGDSVDIRGIVQRTIEINRIGDKVINPGMVLTIPVISSYAFNSPR